MGTLVIKNQSLNTQAEYKDETKAIALNVNYATDPQTGSLKNISGTVNDISVDPAVGLGTFSGYIDAGGNMQYNFSGISDLQKLREVASVINDLVNQITNED